VQDAWLRLQRSDPNNIEDLDAWLTTVVARLCLNAIRDRRRRSAEPLDAFHPEPIVSQTAHSDPEHEALLADHPTTGGYPVIAVVREDDLHLAAQLRPGQQLAFAVD
jgi:DNA-directed RNA polymerase specialized sigma24 family protein